MTRMMSLEILWGRGSGMGVREVRWLAGGARGLGFMRMLGRIGRCLLGPRMRCILRMINGKLRDLGLKSPSRLSTALRSSF